MPETPICAQPLVYVLILNWKSAQDTIECVESVQKSDYPNYKILLIDNGSPDDSENNLRARFPDLEFIQTGKNLGYAGGNNVGIRHAYSQGAEYFWILNPDIRTNPESLTVMIGYVENDKKIGVCGPVIVEQRKNREPYKVYGWQLLPETGWGGKRNLKYDDPLDYVYGCSMLIRTELVKEVGLFRDEFFMYSEEKELCLRAKKNLWKICIAGETFNTHFYTSKTSGYFGCRNEILISRIEKQRRLKTIIVHLGLDRFVKLLVQSKVRESLYVLKWMCLKKTVPVFSGLLTKIQPIPTLL